MIRFGPYEVELDAREPGKSDIRLRIEQKPLQVLTALLDRPGRVVTRHELRQRLWPERDASVSDSELTKAVRKLRQALGDAAVKPRWVETIPRVGYRFLGTVQDPPATALAEVPGARAATEAEPGCARLDRRPLTAGCMVGRYKILAELGAGGMGFVLKAEDMRLRRAVALKFLSQASLERDGVRERLIREAQAAASLDHPNIGAVYGIEEDAGRTFIVMAYIEGPSLAEKIKAGPLRVEEAIDFACQIAEGLRAAHAKGVVHRDVKPENLMVDGDGRVKIMDFGLAMLAGRSRITKSGTTLGTTAYMAPEQLQGSTVDHRADLWALGVVFYQMLTGRPPFDGRYEQAIAYEIVNEDFPPATACCAGLSPAIDDIIGRALAKDSGQRYRCAADLLADLRALRLEATTAARRVSSRLETRGWFPEPFSASARPRLFLAFTAGALLASLASLGFLH